MNLNDSETSHRFTLLALAPNGEPRTLIGWRVATVVGEQVVRRVVLTLDTTYDAAVVLTPAQAQSLAERLTDAASS